MTTVLQLLEAGNLRSTANDPGKLSTDPEIIPFLNRKFQGYFALAAASSPDAFMSKASVVLALVGTDVTAALPTDLISLMRVERTNGDKVNIIPAIERDKTWHVAPAIYRRGLTLYSRKLTGDPTPGETLVLDVLDAPATLSVLATVLDTRWPVRFDELLILDTAVYLSAKDEGRDMNDFKKLVDERVALAAIFFKLNGITTTGKESPFDAAVRARGEN